MSLSFKIIAFGILVSSLIAGQVVYAQGVEKPSQLVVPTVDLEITGQTKVPAGNDTEITLNFNVGEYAVTNAVLELSFSDQVLINKASGIGQISENTVTWNYDSLALDNYIETIAFTLPSPIANGTVIKLNSSLDTNETEVISEFLDITIMSAPFLEVSKTIVPTSLAPGEETVISLKITNLGTDLADNIIISETLPDQLQFINSEDITATRKIGQILADDSVIVDFQVRLKAGAAADQLITNTIITSDNHDDVFAQASIEVTPIISLELDTQETPKEVEQEEVPIEDEQQITIPQGQVLGASTTTEELTETGISFRDWITVFLATFLITLGITTLLFYPFSQKES